MKVTAAAAAEGGGAFLTQNRKKFLLFKLSTHANFSSNPHPQKQFFKRVMLLLLID